ncbi:MAG: hypothetical protein IPJ98_10970 [Bryobacterales bacterium]|nr:hypothetical protein [Bryobacterales bacterium]
MRIHSLLPFLFLNAGCALYAQTANPELTINPGSAWLSANPTTVVFTADIVSPQNPLGVTLYLVDDSDAVLSTQGELRDDGISPDQVAGDKKFAYEMELPIDKIGLFWFIVRAEFPSPIGVRQSVSKAFAVKSETPTNAERDLWATPTEDGTWVHFITEEAGIRKVKLFRANSSGGPWMLIADVDYPGGNGVEKGEIFAPDTGVAASSFYYKMDQYDANAVLKYTSRLCSCPSYGRRTVCSFYPVHRRDPRCTLQTMGRLKKNR